MTIPLMSFDCAPVVAIGGASPVSQFGIGAFQEIDQVAVMRPVTKWAERVYEARRIPQYLDTAFGQAISGKPGPVYLDLPGDVLDEEVDEEMVRFPRKPKELSRAAASPEALDRAVRLLEKAQKPLILSGSGVLWSRAAESFRKFIEATGIPFYTTPQGRGVVPEDHEYHFASARSTVPVPELLPPRSFTSPSAPYNFRSASRMPREWTEMCRAW